MISVVPRLRYVGECPRCGAEHYAERGGAPLDRCLRCQVALVIDPEKRGWGSDD